MVRLKQAIINPRFIIALVIQFSLEKLRLRAVVSNTAIPITRNQGVKKIEMLPLKAVVTKSWSRPQKVNVSRMDKETGRNFLSGLKMNFPR